MPICIYCKCDSSSSTSIPHVMPEALASNELILPIGTECDACNAYAGNKLEQNLIRYPDIAFAIQFLGTPGKRGKPRSKVGGVVRKRVDPLHVSVSLKALGKLVMTADGKRTLEGRVPPQSDFDFLRFRRALHHIGLNTVAAQQGADAALESRFDNVRRYVKHPKPRDESWPYGQIRRGDFPRLIGVGMIEYENIELVGIHVFNLILLVDLSHTGLLADATSAMNGVFVPAEATEPPPTTIGVGDR